MTCALSASILRFMRMQFVQFITWATIAGAVASAIWLAEFAPQRPFGATPRADSSVEVMMDSSLWDAPPAAGPAASAPAASTPL